MSTSCPLRKIKSVTPAAADSGPGGPSGLVGYTKKRNTCKVTATRTAKTTADIPNTRSSRRHVCGRRSVNSGHIWRLKSLVKKNLLAQGSSNIGRCSGHTLVVYRRSPLRRSGDNACTVRWVVRWVVPVMFEVGCDAANERVVLKRQRHSWDWEKDEPMWRGGCNAIGRRMSRWPRTFRYEFGSMVGHERGPTDAYGGSCQLCLS